MLSDSNGSWSITLLVVGVLCSASLVGSGRDVLCLVCESFFGVFKKELWNVEPCVVLHSFSLGSSFDVSTRFSTTIPFNITSHMILKIP